LVEKLIAQVVRLSIIIRNLAAFYNYNFEIGMRERRKANGKGRKAEGGRRKAKGQREKVKKLKQPNKPNQERV
jgi:hypothetical protein